MGTSMIVVVDVFLHRSVQLLPVQNEHMIEALSLQASNETLANRIGLRRLNRHLQFFSSRASGEGRKQTTALLSRSRINYLGPRPPGDASLSCRAVQGSIGFLVTAA